METQVEKDRLERNKRNVMAFYAMAFNEGRPEEAVERYVGAHYIQHNPTVGDGTGPFIAYFKAAAGQWPGMRVDFVHAIAEGDLVMVHCRQHWPGDRDYAAMDLFRLDDDGKLVEHWDVLQPVPEHSANDNTMF